jgi:predicted chitinase
MEAWTEFLNETKDNPLSADSPGDVMVAFLNRFMRPMTGLRYKMIMEGQTIEGLVDENDAGVRLKPKTTAHIEAYVWSIDQGAYKRLESDVQPALQRNTLCRYVCDTVLVKAELQPHKEEDTDTSIPRASEPTPPAPHGLSPTENQGVLVEQTRNARNEPVTAISRPVPDKITLAQLQGICPKADAEHLQAIADELNTDLSKYKLDTPMRRAHFFGQIKQEAGDKLDAVEESLNYSPAGLKGTFGYYAKNPQEAEEDGRVEGIIKKAEWKVVNGRNRLFERQYKGVIKPADQEAIANKVYGPEPGKARDLGNDLKVRGDGWKYRGRGLKQLTGRRNYDDFTNEYKKYWNQDKDFLTSPELVQKMPDLVRSAVWFWLRNACWKQADKDAGKAAVSDEVIDAITKIVNSGEYKQHQAGQYPNDEAKNPVLKRRSNVKLAFRYFT